MAQYLKPDSELGYVEDNAQIEYLKFNNLRHSVLGCMLGDFNEVGDYVVSPEIVSELIAMEKYIVQTYDNIELCKSVLKLDKQISFMVTFEGNKATLSLVEKMNYEGNFAMNKGTYSNINEYVLDSVETSGEINRNVVYDRWNISPYGGNVVDIFNCDSSVLERFFGIVNRFKYLLEANKYLLQKEEQIEEIEANYANDIFEIIKRYPKLEKEVIETVKKTMAEKKGAVKIDKPFFAKTFNEVLENAIEKNLDVLEENERQEFEAEKHNATMRLNIKREEVVDIDHQKRENVAQNEISPTIITLKVPNITDSKPVSELGEDFLRAHKETNERIANEKEGLSSDKKSGKGRLLSLLTAYGITQTENAEKKEETVVSSSQPVNKVGTASQVNKQQNSNRTSKGTNANKPVKAEKSGKTGPKPTNNSSNARTQQPKNAQRQQVKTEPATRPTNRIFAAAVARAGGGNLDTDIMYPETNVRRKKTHDADVARMSNRATVNSQANATLDHATKDAEVTSNVADADVEVKI